MILNISCDLALLRCGRRTFFGLVQDGVNAISRYYLNNFKDGVRQVWKRAQLSTNFGMVASSSFIVYILLWAQDAMDLVLGHYSVSRNAPSPFELNGFESFAVSLSCSNAGNGSSIVFSADIHGRCD